MAARAGGLNAAVRYGAKMPLKKDRYSHGHHESVLRSHRWRNLENSAAYLLDRLAPGQELLDVGCGPGTITLEFARRVAPGRVVGIDVSADVLDTARALQATTNDDGVSFVQESVYQLSFADSSFDVVHAHQLLQHLADPVAALTEMRRVLRPGATLAVRESDYGAFAWSPLDERLRRWMEIYHQITRQNGAEADAGRHLVSWVRRAGFASLEVTSSNWVFQRPEERQWWGGLWADRVRESEFARQGIEYGFTSAAELDDIADAFHTWAASDDGVFIVVHAEVLARR